MNRLLLGVHKNSMRCRPSTLYSPFVRMVKLVKATLYSPFVRMVKLVKARSSDDDCKICCGGSSDGKTYEEVDFGSIFSEEEKAQKDGAGNPKEVHYQSVFTGELEKRYLYYLQKLDWSSISDHVSDFPRGRSRTEDEMKVVFEKWMAYYGRKYQEENKWIKFLIIKKKLERIDAHNSTDKPWKIGLNQWS